MLRRPIYGVANPLAERPLVERLVESLDRVVRERAPSAPRVLLESDPLEAFGSEEETARSAGVWGTRTSDSQAMRPSISDLTDAAPLRGLEMPPSARTSYSREISPSREISHLPYGGLPSPTQPRYRMRCQPQAGVTFKTQRRLELLVRLENAGVSDSQCASMLSISVPRVRQLKRSKDYLRARIKITHGLILDQDLALSQIATQRRDILREMLPPALQVIANAVSTRPSCFAEAKLQVSVAQDILDREGTFAKISRSEVKPVEHFDWESTDATASQIVSLMRGAIGPDGTTVRMGETHSARLIEISKAFTAGSNISPEEAIAAAKMLDAAGPENSTESGVPAPPEGWASPTGIRKKA